MRHADGDPNVHEAQDYNYLGTVRESIIIIFFMRREGRVNNQPDLLRCHVLTRRNELDS